MNVTQSMIWIGGALATVAATAALAVAPSSFEISRFTIDGGGSMVSAGNGFELSGTIGQPDTGESVGGGFVLTGGFWFEQSPGDCNEDGGINLYDYRDFEVCFSGPDGILPNSPCACFDLDSDRDVDMQDARAFQLSFSGG